MFGFGMQMKQSEAAVEVLSMKSWNWIPEWN